MTDLPPALAELSILATARENAEQYYAPLLDSLDPVLRAGAWSALLERGEVGYDLYPRLLALTGTPGIRDRAFRYFMRFFDYDFAAKVLAVAEGHEEAEARRRVKLAELACDDAERAVALRELFLVTANTETLVELVGLEDHRAGWRNALPVAVQLVVLNPHDPGFMLDLLHFAHESRQVEILEAVVSALETSGLHQPSALLYSAACKLMKGNPAGCLKTLSGLSQIRVPRPDIAARLRAVALYLTAEALEKLGEYRKAFAAYADMKAISASKPIALSELTDMVTQSAAIDIPELPEDVRHNHFVMTGFPRSGTTLLENALAVHPGIETFEEIPSGSSAHIYLDRVLPGLGPDDDRAQIFLNARDRYYAEAERRHQKATADVFIDKMPIRSAEAEFMVKLFPDKRYVFSIRHPYDVVLSCFKQRFSLNTAMEHFRTFESAARLYDFTMERWFSVFDLDDPRVHYVRYDRLVEDFEPTVRGVLGFLGVDWDDSVRGFATAAAARPARTPSYQKVRQGLSIGVQTQWENYRFAFQSEAAKPLKKWAEFFGYHIG